MLLVKALLRFRKIAFPFFLLLFVSACATTRFFTLPPKVVKGVYHPVKKGETLWRICKTYGVDLQEVAELNDIRDASQIEVGDRIFISGATRVREVKTFKEEPPQKKVKIVQSRGKFSWPVEGEVVTYFGIQGGKISDGIDIRASLGTPVKAADAGKVVFAHRIAGYGNILVIEHQNRYTTVYAHNQVNLVKEGTMVKREGIIAKVGNSHDSMKYPTLHFQVRQYNKARNPLFYLQ